MRIEQRMGSWKISGYVRLYKAEMSALYKAEMSAI